MVEKETNEKVLDQAVELASLRTSFEAHAKTATGLLTEIGRQSGEQTVAIVRLQEQHKALGETVERYSGELGRGMKRIVKLETAATSGKTLYTVFVGLGGVAVAFMGVFLAAWLKNGG